MTTPGNGRKDSSLRGHDCSREDDFRRIDTWIAAHDAKIAAYWEAQHSWNDKTDGWRRHIETRLTAIERRVMWLSGIAAALGAFGGNLVERLFGG